MKNLPLAGSRPLFVCILLLIGFLLGCRKDNFTTVEDLSQTNNPASLSANYPISIEEAEAHFSSLNLKTTNSFTGSEFYFVEIEPLWGLAFVGHSQSGREIVVVPLPDNDLRSLNQGRAGAKLLFSKISEDSISADLLVFLADTAYFQVSNQTLDFNTFTGAFLLFDVNQHFKGGVNVIAGSAVGKAKSLNNEGESEVRDDTDDEDCPTHFESMMAPCPPQVFTECYTLTVAAMYDCSGVGGGFGGGNNGGNNNGNNTGGNTGGGNGNGSGNSYTPPNFWDVMAGQIPLEIFVQNGGTLPEGFDMQLFQQFIDIYNYFRNLGQYLSQPQLQWLEDHPEFVSIIWHILSVPEAGDERSMLRPVLNFAMAHGLNAAQYQFLVYNGAVFQAMQTFLVQHQNNATAVQIVTGLLIQTQGLAGLTLDDLNYLYNNIGGIEEAETPPNNTPISVADPICASILTFTTLTDDVSNLQYAGMILQNSYFQFNVPGSTPVQIQTYNMKFTADANANPACLVSAPAHAANAINIAVLQTQQLIDGLPGTTTTQQIIDFAKSNLIRRINREFKTQVQNCNADYRTDVVFQAGMFDNWNNLPIVDCDAEIVDCP